MMIVKLQSVNLLLEKSNLRFHDDGTSINPLIRSYNAKNLTIASFQMWSYMLNPRSIARGP